MTKDEVLKLALEALNATESDCGGRAFEREQEAITAIKEALAQPEPWEKFCDSNCVWTDHHPDCKLAQRKPLSDEEIILIVAECASSHQHTDIHLARAIEAAHGIKRLV